MSVIYHVLPEKRRVVAVLKVESGETFHGVAKCNPTDTFDEQVGKDIAYKRMRKSFLRQKKIALMDSIYFYEQRIAPWEKKKAKVQAALDRTIEELESLTETSIALK